MPRKLILKVLVILVPIVLTACQTDAPSNDQSVDLSLIAGSNPEITSLEQSAEGDENILRIRPSESLQAITIWENGESLNWDDAQYLVVEIWHENEFSGIVNIDFFRKAGGEPRITAKIGVLPLLKTKFIFPLKHLDGQEIFLQRFPRQLKGTVSGSRLAPEDISRVMLRFSSVMESVFEPEIQIAEIYLTDVLPEPLPAPAIPVVDKFGQWNRKDWPGKVRTEDQLHSVNNSLFLAVQDAKFPENLSEYGGWKKKRFEITGFFRTHHDGNRWWLVDPEGYAFLSAGVDCIGPDAAGVLGGQEELFGWLPEGDGLLSTAVSDRGETEMIDFYRINLMRVYGENWRTKWRETTIGLIRTLGLNTIGNWSDMDFARSAEIPYVLPLKDFPSTEVKLFRDFPDVYAHEYRAAAGEFAQQLEEYKDDPYLIGYFLRNEPHWAFGFHNIAFEMFATDRSSYTKSEFVEWLREKYRDIDRFNSAWRLKLNTFSELETHTFKEFPSDNAGKDCYEFTEIMVGRYVDIPCDKVEKVDPQHLKLGMRYAWLSSDLLYKAGERFDVFSINGYSNPGPPETAEIARRSGKPVLIGEFHFGAVDHGLPATGIQAALSQHERGTAYRY